jgi:hypothetical protein
VQQREVRHLSELESDASRDARQKVALSDSTLRSATGSEVLQRRSKVCSSQAQDAADDSRTESSEPETESTVTQQKPPEDGEVQFNPIIIFIKSPSTGRAKKAAPLPRQCVKWQRDKPSRSVVFAASSAPPELSSSDKVSVAVQLSNVQSLKVVVALTTW